MVQTTVTSAAAWSPDLHVVAARDAVPSALILQTSTVAATVEGDAVAVRVQYVDDAAATFTAEAAALTESDPGLSECLVYSGKVTQLIKLSREQWYQPNAQELLSASVRRAVTKAGNAAYLAQAAPTPPAVSPAAGLANVTGIIDGGAIASDLDALVDLLGALAANDGNPSHIVISPTAWASLRKFKTGTDYNSSLLGVGATDAVPYLLGVPVIVDSAVPTDTGLVLDRTAIVSAVGPVNVATSEHAFFNADSIAVRATWRFGANIVKPDRVGRFTVTAPTTP